MKKKQNARVRRHLRVRKRMRGSASRPRLAVFRSAKHIYVQAIDDLEGRTLVSASSLMPDLPSIDEEGLIGKKKTAKAVGQLIAQRLKDIGIESVIFDRGGFLYHGRIAALADGARAGGLKF
ncbi:MAG: 50S ribosomal protein L18 [Candidatus Omnitrophica bacterium]|nr:50S ribosomal protein L18 [Candidatus Omnitrophota bacterium]